MESALPDASTGQGPDTLARKLSRCKEGIAHFLPSRYRTFWPLRVSRYRVVKVFVNYQGAVKLIAGSGAFRVCQAVLSCLGSRSKSKKCDKQLTHIDRVSFSGILFYNLESRVFCFSFNPIYGPCGFMPNLMSKIAVINGFIFVTNSINLRKFIGDRFP